MAQNIPDFDRPDNQPSGIIKWMWWIYVVVGLFIVCLLIWMFVALSKHNIDEQKDDYYISTEQTVPMPE